jgi:glycerol-3-phosphate dehydrogenase
MIGSGAYGHVVLAFDKKNQTKVYIWFINFLINNNLIGSSQKNKKDFKSRRSYKSTERNYHIKKFKPFKYPKTI